MDQHPRQLPMPAPSPAPQKLDILRAVFGYGGFRPGQEDVIDALLAGRNVLAVMPTGSGKSLCYQVPALLAGGLTIVVSPLIALMQDQVAALRLAGVPADSINSNLSREDNVAAWKRAAKGETRLLYLAPERLMSERMLAALGSVAVKLIAIDEAHCISQWGASFRPEYEALARLRRVFPGIPIGAFTATADEVTRNDIVAKLFDGEADVVVHGFDRPNIKLSVATKRNTFRQLTAFLERHRGESGIVYCLSRKDTEKMAAQLKANGVNALAYHAGLDKRARDDNQAIFMTEPGIVMCATIAFGMGIDKADIRFVFHADLPGSPEAYYQEIGRAGRDGAPAEAWMIFGLEDLRVRRMFIDQEDAGDERRRREHKRLDALVAYCESPTCRRQALLAYFGEAIAPCGNCDVCLDPVETADGTIEAQKILSAVHRTGQRYGAAHIVDILEGKAAEKITAAGHDRLPTFGVGRDRGRNEWRSLIRQLVGAGYLTLDVKGHGGLSISDKGRALLKGEERFRYRKDMIRGSKRKEREKAIADAGLSSEQEELLAHLKALRFKLSRQRRVPPYVIFSDRTLIDMVQRSPRNHEEFAAVNGVGESKLAEFADVFLAEIARGRPVIPAKAGTHPST
jgi:ATP-dependent DNA helicase RecQ